MAYERRYRSDRSICTINEMINVSAEDSFIYLRNKRQHRERIINMQLRALLCAINNSDIKKVIKTIREV